MTLSPVSVVVVSRDRPEMLRRCLVSLAQVDHPPYEIIVVSNEEGYAAVEACGFAQDIKFVFFDEPNISDARNAGIIAAAGDIIAFIDDDAVAEPLWLLNLTAPIQQMDAVGAGGFVRGRNGISFQWQGRTIDRLGYDHPVDVPEVSLVPNAKTEGTNMAFRRDVLINLGGFDTAFRFYMDETDLNWRLAEQGLPVAIVPMAQVHHGYSASGRRTAKRVPTDLFDIGRSLTIFLRKSGVSDDEISVRLKSERSSQLQRIKVHLQSRRIKKEAMRKVLATFENGIKSGMNEKLNKLSPLADDKVPWCPYPTIEKAKRSDIIARWYNAQRKFEEARNFRKKGHIVSIYYFSLTMFYHRVTFTNDGIWVQKGGLFGRSLRTDRLFRWWTKSSRMMRENERNDGIRYRLTNVDDGNNN